MGHLASLGFFLGVLLGGFGLWDWWLGASAHPPSTLGVLGAGVLLGYVGSRRAAPRPRTALLCVYALAVGVMPWVDWDSRKPFLRDLYSVKPGMERAQVEAIMGKYIHGTGWPANPYSTGEGVLRTDSLSGSAYPTVASPNGQLELKDCIVYRHRQDSDWGVVRFREGRVVSVEFLPD